MGDKWTLLIVRDLAAGPRRFVELQRILPGISTEQLRSRLNRMVADGMLTRKRYREVPPRVDYELTERARALMPILGELARWGYQWAWSAPRSSEAVDIGAIFRLGPGLIGSPDREGMLEFTVSDQHQGGTAYTFTISRVEVKLEEGPSERPLARVKGDQASWVKALSPENDHSGLEISGEHELAEWLLSSLAGATAEQRRARRVSSSTSAAA